MTIAEVCLVGAVLIYILTLWPAKVGGRAEYDNAKPRDPGFYRDGLRARALGAHNNGLEAFPLFAAAVLLAEFRGVHQAIVDGLAVLFLVVRLIYVAAYLGNRPTFRSGIWSVGLLINLAIFFSPLYGR